MGTNYYMRLREPERGSARLSEIIDWRYEKKVPGEVLDITVPLVDGKPVHIAKCSWGWVPSFQHVPAGLPFDETEENNDRYSITCVNDIRAYLDTGDYEVVNEYGDVLTREEFEHRVVEWADRQRENGFVGELRNHTDEADSLNAYTDPDGYQFCKTCFC